jgi:hypothetical protein
VVLRIVGGLNMIRGFFIFLVFICKPAVWRMTKKRHPKLARALALPFSAARKKWLDARHQVPGSASDMQMHSRDPVTTSPGLRRTLGSTTQMEVSQV